MHHFKKYGNPSTPWSLHLNFNRNHTSFPLQRHHFTEDGIDLSPMLVRKLSDIDPKHSMIRSSEPVVLHAATKRSIPISNSGSVEEMVNRLSNQNGEPEVTLFSILDVVFGVMDTD